MGSTPTISTNWSNMYEKELEEMVSVTVKSHIPENTELAGLIIKRLLNMKVEANPTERFIGYTLISTTNGSVNVLETPSGVLAKLSETNEAL